MNTPVVSQAVMTRETGVLEPGFWRGKVMLAPLAGVTDYPMREMARHYQADLTYTEMISSEALIRHHSGTLEMLPEPDETGRVFVQLFGSRPDSMAEASRLVEERGALGIDVNMGCPVPKVTGTGAGAALLREPVKIAGILSRMRQATRLPITLKIRSGWERPDLELMKTIARVALEEGCQAITLHARSRNEKFAGQADWNMIRELVQMTSLPIIGNGDVKTGLDAAAMFEQTGCEAIMVGRAALGRPWVFSEIAAFLSDGSPSEPPAPAELLEIAIRHLHLAIQKYGAVRGVKIMRKQLAWYIKGLPGAREFRSEIVRIDDLACLERRLRDIASSFGESQ